MATYTWNATPGTTADWNTPSDWIGGVVPNSPDATVVFPLITYSGGTKAYYTVNIAAGEAFSVGSIQDVNSLEIFGALSVAGTLSLNGGGEVGLSGGTLDIGGLAEDAGVISIGGFGMVRSSGTIVNAGEIVGSGLTLSFAGLSNTGTIEAGNPNNSISVDVTGGAGSFANLSGTTLTGGAYAAFNSGTLAFAVSGSIVTDAASITMSGATASITTLGGSGTVQLQSSLTTIAAGGLLAIGGFNYATPNTLEVDGILDLGNTPLVSVGSIAPGTLTAAGIIVGQGGTIQGTGLINGPIGGAGTVMDQTGLLTVASPNAVALAVSDGTLELVGGASGTVTFVPTSYVRTGNIQPTLQLDNPASFTGTIAGYATRGHLAYLPKAYIEITTDQIALAGISLASVQGEIYAGGPQGGVLSIQTSSGTVSLHFTGNFQLSDFVLSAGAQAYSNSSPSLIVSNPNNYNSDPRFTITGTVPGQTTADNAPIQPFSQAVINDTNTGYVSERITVTWSSAANGTLSDPNAAIDGGAGGVGSLTFNALSGQIATQYLRALVFTPTPGQVFVGNTVTTSFVVSGSEAGSLPPEVFSDSHTSVAATAAASTPRSPTGGSFINAAASTTITDISANAANIAAWAHYDLFTATAIGNAAPGISTTALDGNGDIAVYSTPDSAGHVIAADGTGQSVIAAGSGRDTVTAANGSDLIATGVGANNVYLQTGTNQLRSEGQDTINVGGGADQIEIAGAALINPGNASLGVTLDPGASLTMGTGTASVSVQGGYGGGAFSGGTNGANLLVAGTSQTTLYAGGNNDTLVASGGSGTTMYGWGGQETLTGQYSQGNDVFNQGGANVLMVGGAGANAFDIGTGHADIVAELGTDLFTFTSGNANTTYIAGFKVGIDAVHLAGFAPDETSNALAGGAVYQGSEILTLRDGTSITFGGVTGLTGASFV